jgi:hypothetical protein
MVGRRRVSCNSRKETVSRMRGRALDRAIEDRARIVDELLPHGTRSMRCSFFDHCIACPTWEGRADSGRCAARPCANAGWRLEGAGPLSKPTSGFLRGQAGGPEPLGRTHELTDRFFLVAHEMVRCWAKCPALSDLRWDNLENIY